MIFFLAGRETLLPILTTQLGNEVLAFSKHWVEVHANFPLNLVGLVAHNDNEVKP